jgi:hypothetical protein
VFKTASSRQQTRAQGLEKIVTIDIVQLNVLTAISPANDVVHGAGILKAKFASH